MQTVRTLQTRNNTYKLIRTARTTYEQQQEDREESLYMIKQKLVGSGLLLTGIAACIFVKDATLLFLTTPLGIGTVLTKDHVIGW